MYRTALFQYIEKRIETTLTTDIFFCSHYWSFNMYTYYNDNKTSAFQAEIFPTCKTMPKKFQKNLHMKTSMVTQNINTCEVIWKSVYWYSNVSFLCRIDYSRNVSALFRVKLTCEMDFCLPASQNIFFFHFLRRNVNLYDENASEVIRKR